MTIAEKYAAQYQPNGEVSLADLIQAAVDEAVESRRHEVAMHAVQQIKAEIGQSVPVAGEPVAWVRKDQLQHVNMFGPALCHVYATEQPGTVALIIQPTTSITAAELDALRKCKDLLAEARDDVNSVLNDLLVLGNYPHNKRRLRIQQELLANIDAAIAQEKGE